MNKKYLLVVISILLLACAVTGTPTIVPPMEPSATAIIPPVDSTSTALPPPTGGPTLANCPMFPANNFWNTRVDSLPVHSQSDSWIDSIGRDEGFHMDFGSGEWDGGPIGIPYNVAAGSTVPSYEPEFYYPDESDAGPYPIPENPNREWGSDHHILVVDTETCTL